MECADNLLDLLMVMLLSVLSWNVPMKAGQGSSMKLVVGYEGSQFSLLFAHNWNVPTNHSNFGVVDG